MPSTKYPTRTMRVPWFSPEEANAFPELVFFNWRPEQRLAPQTEEEAEYAMFARVGEPVLSQFWIDMKLHQYLKSLKEPTRLLVVHQGYGGTPVTVTIASVTVGCWSIKEHLPRLDITIGDRSDHLWGPLVLCVAPLSDAAPCDLSVFEERGEDVPNPRFMRLVKQFGIPRERVA